MQRLPFSLKIEKFHQSEKIFYLEQAFSEQLVYIGREMNSVINHLPICRMEVLVVECHIVIDYLLTEFSI